MKRFGSTDNEVPLITARIPSGGSTRATITRSSLAYVLQRAGESKNVNASEYFDCADYRFTRLWHCFGNAHNLIDLPTIIQLLQASGTNVLPINTHMLPSFDDRRGLQIGYGGVTLDTLAQQFQIDHYIKMININLATDSEEAIRRALRAHELTGERILKLEVLNKDHATSNDEALLTAASELKCSDKNFIIMPLISPSLRTARALADLGCPLLRVMGSAIGSCSGISDTVTFGRICEIGVPVILDGGVGSPGDFRAARTLGAAGALINSMLFTKEPAPVLMTAFRSALFDAAARESLVS